MSNVTITLLEPGESQEEHGATLGELINAQNGGQGIFVAGRAAAFLTWRTPYKLNPNGQYWRFWMDTVVRHLIEDIECGNISQLRPPEVR